MVCALLNYNYKLRDDLERPLKNAIGTLLRECVSLFYANLFLASFKRTFLNGISLSSNAYVLFWFS